jgi:hypothetical protein
MHSIMDVATVARSCFKNNAHEMMVHMLMSCSYDAQMQGKTPRVLHPPPWRANQHPMMQGRWNQGSSDAPMRSPSAQVSSTTLVTAYKYPYLSCTINRGHELSCKHTSEKELSRE